MNEHDLPPETEERALWRLQCELAMSEEDARKALEITRWAFTVAPDHYQRLYFWVLERKQEADKARAQAEFELAQVQGNRDVEGFDYVRSHAEFRKWAVEHGMSQTSADRLFDRFLKSEGIKPLPHARLILSPEQSQKLRDFTRRDLTYRRAVGRAQRRENGESGEFPKNGE